MKMGERCHFSLDSHTIKLDGLDAIKFKLAVWILYVNKE